MLGNRVIAGLDGQAIRGRLATRESMARHTSWKVGGPADLFFVPVDADDLAVFLAALPVEEPVTWIGLGSNVLVRDGGIRGAVISTAGMRERLELLPHRAVRGELRRRRRQGGAPERQVRPDRR